jgi:hypothetical protein
MKRLIFLIVMLCAVLSSIGCQMSTQTTESQEQTLTGTFFLWRQEVFEHFATLDLDTFELTEVREYVSADEPENYRVAAVDTVQMRTQIASMFEGFDISHMFPGAPIDWAKVEIDLTHGTETLRIVIVVRGPNDGVVGFIHTDAENRVVSQGYPLDTFAAEVAAILDMVSVVHSICTTFL